MTKQLTIIATVFLLSSCNNTPIEKEAGIKDTCAEYVYLTGQEKQGWGKTGTYSDGSKYYIGMGTLEQYICLKHK